MFLLIASTNAWGQGTELLYSPQTLTLALKYKKTIGEEHFGTTNALSLNNISNERESAYLKKIDSKTSVILLGKLAMKAAGPVKFSMPVIIIGACGEIAATGPAFAVIESGSGADDCTFGDVISISDIDSFSLQPENLKDGARLSIECKGVSLPDMVNRILAEIARINK